jgi:hypothetical protein
VDFFVTIPEKKGTGYCCVKFCRGKAKKKSHNGNFCRRCRDRRYALSNPVSYAWDKLRYSAKRRSIPFSLTIEEFRVFCEETGYIQQKGKTSTCLSIDRVDATKGYSIGNIQTLTQSENGRKAHVDKKLAGYRQPEMEPAPDDGDPF